MSPDQNIPPRLDRDDARVPARRLVVLTCMDARIDLRSTLDVKPGDAHVLRNAGGRVTEDVLRALVLSQTYMDTRSVIVIHHTGCGLAQITNETIRADAGLSLGMPPDLDFMPLEATFEASLAADLERLAGSGHVLPGTLLTGAVYDVATHRVEFLMKRTVGPGQTDH